MNERPTREECIAWLKFMIEADMHVGQAKATIYYLTKETEEAHARVIHHLTEEQKIEMEEQYKKTMEIIERGPLYPDRVMKDITSSESEI